MTCGERIKMKRKELELTQEELGEKVGLSFGAISKYEKDKISIPADKLMEIANVLGVSVDYLLGNTNITNAKKVLEDLCLKYELTETEYNLIFNDLINNKTINLSLLKPNNSKINQVYSEIIKIYSDYFTTYSAENVNMIDNKFINMIKTIDKNKIIHKETSNVFPVAETYKMYPVLGKISAGLPILATENIYDYLTAPVPSSKINSYYEYFFLKIQGDSMDKKYPNGSLVFVQKQDVLENDCIGVILIDDEATVKRYRKENNFIILEPMSNNPIHKTQMYSIKDKNVRIIGKVILSVNYE